MTYYNVGDLEGFHFPCIHAPGTWITGHCKNRKLVDIWIWVWQILTSQILLNKSLLAQQGADDATAQEIPFPYKILADFVSANYQRV